MCLTFYDILSETLLLGNLLGNILGKWYTVFNITSVADLKNTQEKVRPNEKSKRYSAHLLGGLVWDLVHYLAALLPRDGDTLLPRHHLALLLINITRLHHGLVLAHLVGNLATFLTGFLDIIANLKGNKGLDK